MTRRKLYIHVGPHKTGTSTIQNGLDSNIEALRSQGYDYPKVGYVYKGHGNIVSDLTNSTQFNSILGGLNELRDYANECTYNLIISSENFDGITTKAPLEKIHKTFGSDFEIHIIGYLRAQTELLVSLWKSDHWWKGAGIPFHLWLTRNVAKHQFLDFDEFSDLVASVFGQDKVHLEIFKPNNENLFFEFLNLCGIKDTSSFQRTANANISMPDSAFELMRQLYFHPYQKQPNQTNQYKEAYKQSIKTAPKLITSYLDEVGIDLKTSMYTQETLEKVETYFLQSNKSLAQKKFGRNQLFQSPRLSPCKNHILEKLNRKHLIELSSRLLIMERSLVKQHFSSKGRD